MQNILVNWHLRRGQVLTLFILSVIGLTFSTSGVSAHAPRLVEPDYVITGRLVDSQSQPISAAEVSLETAGQENSDHAHAGGPVTAVTSHEDGTWLLSLSALPPANAQLIIERPHYSRETIPLENIIRRQLQETHVYDVCRFLDLGAAHHARFLGGYANFCDRPAADCF